MKLTKIEIKILKDSLNQYIEKYKKIKEISELNGIKQNYYNEEDCNNLLLKLKNEDNDYNKTFISGNKRDISMFKNYDFAMTIIFNHLHNSNIKSYCEMFNWKEE